jgi:hypothetical protein
MAGTPVLVPSYASTRRHYGTTEGVGKEQTLPHLEHQTMTYDSLLGRGHYVSSSPELGCIRSIVGSRERS